MSARVGFINSYNASEGTATVRYPDRGNEVTGDLMVFAPLGMQQDLEKDQMVLVIHLDSGSEEGVVIGGFEGSGATIKTTGGHMSFRDSSGSTTLQNIINKL